MKRRILKPAALPQVAIAEVTDLDSAKRAVADLRRAVLDLQQRVARLEGP